MILHNYLMSIQVREGLGYTIRGGTVMGVAITDQIDFRSGNSSRTVSPFCFITEENHRGSLETMESCRNVLVTVQSHLYSLHPKKWLRVLLASNLIERNQERYEQFPHRILG